MAGDWINWIKMRVDIDRDPHVIEMANILAGDIGFRGWLGDPVRRSFDHVYDHVTPRVVRDIVVTALRRIWGIALERGKRDGDDCLLDLCTEFTLDEISDTPGMGPAMTTVGWAVAGEDGWMRFPKLLQENILVSERGAERKRNQSRESTRRSREKREADAVTTASQCDAKVTPRRDKRRVDIKEGASLERDATSAASKSPEELARAHQLWADFCAAYPTNKSGVIQGKHQAEAPFLAMATPEQEHAVTAARNYAASDNARSGKVMSLSRFITGEEWRDWLDVSKKPRKPRSRLHD